jgi:predicted HTH domain antitoxin
MEPCCRYRFPGGERQTLALPYPMTLTLTLPDHPVLEELSESDLRLDLACALFAAGRISRTVAADMAGVDRNAFDAELYRRRIPSYTEEMLAQDLETLALLPQH